MQTFKKKTTVVIGHDINAGVGTRRARDEDCYNKVLGPYGIDKRNQKGKQLLNFLAVNKLKLMNSYFANSFYSTWSDIKTGDPHMLDVWSTNESKIFQSYHYRTKNPWCSLVLLPHVPWCFPRVSWCGKQFPWCSLMFKRNVLGNYYV